MGLDRLGDDLVAALATAAGVHAPAPPGTGAEEKQVRSKCVDVSGNFTGGACSDEASPDSALHFSHAGLNLPWPA